jgi:phospholipid transport system transporter-binding protein
MLANHERQVQLMNGSLFVSGKLNFGTVMEVWQQSLPLLSQCKELNFDFSGVSQTNTCALALLLEWLKYAKQHQKPLSFIQLPLKLKAIASIAGIDSLV